MCGTLKSAASRSKRARAKATARLRKSGLVLTVRATKKVKALRIRTPKGMAVRSARGITVKSGKRRARVALRKHALKVTRLSSKKVRVKVPKRSLRGATSARRHKRKLTVRVTMGKKAHRTLRVRVR